MLVFTAKDYDSDVLKDVSQLPSEFCVVDHLNGFDTDKKNKLLSQLDASARLHQCNPTVRVSYVVDDQITKNYPNLKFKFCFDNEQRIFSQFSNYKMHPDINFENFVCSFNKAGHVSRKLLVSIMQKFGYFDPAYCSKHFLYSTDTVLGHIQDYADEKDCIYNKFFISDNSEEFFQTLFVSDYEYQHSLNIKYLENKITKSFIHLVSETMATSQYPYITDKFFYSIVTRGLFLAYAQPGWHLHLENIFGFQKYSKIFNYRFDSIEHPLERLVELMCSISKFSILSPADWHDLYQIESDTIEYNYDHYFSGQYLKNLSKYN